MSEQEWLELVKNEESKMFRQLVTLARTIVGSPIHGNGNSGYTTAKHVANRILKFNDKIATIVGDCPE